MTEFHVPQPLDDNGNVLLRGEAIETQCLTSTQSNSRSFNFTTAPKQMALQNVTGVDGIMLWANTTTMANNGNFFLLGNATPVKLETSYSGPYYIRSLSATISLLSVMASL